MAGTIYVNSLWSDEAAFNADSNKPADAVWGTNAFATINGAVTEAKKSTEAVSVVIYSGEYNENINIGGRTFVEDGKTYVGGISFAAADGADVTLNGYIQCNAVAGDIKDIAIDGLTINNSVRNGGYFAPIMFGDNYSGKKASGISITNCTLNSTAEGGTSSGIALTMGLVCDGISIVGNTFNADCAVYGGDGNQISNTVISDNAMNGNEAEPSYNYWGVVYIYNCGEGNVVSGNTIDGSALSAVKINKGNGVVLTDNTISACGDIRITDGSVVDGTTIDGTSLSDSYEVYSGSDIFVYNGIAGEDGDTKKDTDVIHGRGKSVEDEATDGLLHGSEDGGDREKEGVYRDDAHHIDSKDGAGFVKAGANDIANEWVGKDHDEDAGDESDEGEKVKERGGELPGGLFVALH